MKSLQKFFLISFSLLYFAFCGCDKDEGPLTSEVQTYQTSSGAVACIDNYPLYSLEYSGDYKFDEYLLTGNIPFFASNISDSTIFGCTCFSAFGGDTRLTGRNYDWSTHSTYFIVFTNPPNAYSSISTIDLGFFDYNQGEPPDSPDNQAMLRSIPYYPFDGVNEKGVSVGMNALSTSQAPYDPSKVTIGELQCIRLILDYAASTQEAIGLIQQYNIRMENPPIHYLIADSSGHSVIIEFVNGVMEIMHNSDPWQVTTNFVITGLSNPQSAPCWRYRTAYQTLNDCGGSMSESDAVNLLQNVSVSSTRWSSVFNLKSCEIRIAMGRSYNEQHYFTVIK